MRPAMQALILYIYYKENRMFAHATWLGQGVHMYGQAQQQATHTYMQVNTS